jgi:hypothetical protein
MKKILLLSAAVFMLTATFATNNVTIKRTVKASEVYIPIGNTGQKVSLLDLSRMTVKDVQNFTGKKMSFADRLAFKAAQRQLRKNISPDGTIDNKRIAKELKKEAKKADGTTGFHLGGFALGFLLSLIGVLIAYLMNDENKANRIKWSWIGAAVGLVFYLLFLI